MSDSKKVECVICDYGGREHMFIPRDDETKKELNSLWTIYHKLIKVEAREPSACHVNDFSHRDSPVFYSFCNSCLRHVSHLCDLYNQIDKQIELIWAIPNFTQSNDARSNSTNISEPSQMDVNQLTSGAHGNNPKRRKLTHVPAPPSINSQENTVSEDDEIVILEKNLCTQNKDVQMVSIDCGDEEEENNPGLVIKQLDSTDYLFGYKNENFSFKRSQCLLKFDCSMCSTQTQNITGIIRHLWTNHCEDGKVKSLPNYRIDVSNVSSTRQSSVDTENMNIEYIEYEESSSSEPEIINDNSSRSLVALSSTRVFHKKDLYFNRTAVGKWRCSFCRLSVKKDEIVSHTNNCLPKKLGDPSRLPLWKPKSAATTQVPVPSTRKLRSSSILYQNGWPYRKMSSGSFNCAVVGCKIKDKTQLQIFSHLRRKHAGVESGVRFCPHCKSLEFRTTKMLWDHLYEEHNRTHIL